MADNTKKKSKKAKGANGKLFFVLMMIICSLIALPSTILLAIGCLPSIVAFFVDRTKLKARAISVAALNLAACSLYLLKLWAHGNDLMYALSLVAAPMNVIVMYVGAIAGYGIDWFLSGAISQILYAKAKARQQTIKKRQKELIQRWGQVVSGKKQDLGDQEPQPSEHEEKGQDQEKPTKPQPSEQSLKELSSAIE